MYKVLLKLTIDFLQAKKHGGEYREMPVRYLKGELQLHPRDKGGHCIFVPELDERVGLKNDLVFDDLTIGLVRCEDTEIDIKGITLLDNFTFEEIVNYTANALIGAGFVETDKDGALL
jgi:hypothetical protein